MTEAHSRSRVRSSAFDTLRVRSFAWFLTGATLSYAAQWIQQVTLSWLVYDVTSSGALLGTLNLVRSIATLGLAPVAGVAIDRLPRRRLLFITYLWLFILSFGFGLVLSGNPGLIWPLFLFSFLGGIGQAMNTPLTQAVVFSVVPKNKTPHAVALVQTGWAVMRSLGPAIGGFLILWVGPAGNFFVQAVAYALVMVTVMRLNLPHATGRAPQSQASGSFREGWRYVVTTPATRAFLLMQCVLPLLIIPNFDALPPIYAKDIFSGGPDTLGTLLSAVGVGGIVGGIISASLERVDRRGLLQLAALLGLSLSLIGFALSTALWMALAALALAGFFEMIFLTTNQVMLQLSIPDALRGRVTSIISLASGLMPLGAFIAGVGADLVGPRVMTLALAGTAGAVAVVVFFASPMIRNYRLSQAILDTSTSSH